MDLDKQELREKYKNTRLSLTTASVDEKSLEICRKVFHKIDWTKIESMCSYAPIEQFNEVNTKPLHDTVAYKFPKIKIKVLAPGKRQPLPKAKFDLIIVPLLAFDKNYNRLGWGGGFYDRFLARQPLAMKVGVAYQASLVDGVIPHEPHDIPLDMVITER